MFPTMSIFWLKAIHIYVILYALTMLWQVLKPPTYRYRVAFKSRRRDGASADQSPPASSKPDCICVLIHGTWAIKAKWAAPDSDFAKRLATRMPASRDILFDRFRWAGGNSLVDRGLAAEQLQEHVSDLAKTYPRVPVFLVAHSHGGNVALNALRSSQRLQDVVKGICCMATPLIYRAPPLRHTNGPAAAVRFVSPLLLPLLAIAVCCDWWLWRATVHWPDAWLTPAAHGYLALGAAMIPFAACLLWLQRSVKKSIDATTLPHSGLAPDLAARICYIRAAGDEALASLSAAFIINYLVIRSWRWLIGLVRRLKADTLDESLILMMLLCGLFGLLALLAVNPPVDLGAKYPTATLVGRWVVGTFSAFAFVGFLLEVIKHVFNGALEFTYECMMVPADALTAFLLTPFAPELALSPAGVGLMAESAVPATGNTADRLNAYHLAFDQPSGLNHSVYQHPATAGIIARWMEDALAKPAKR